jgi:DNA-binding NarL/FixJ family response regulator
MTENPVTVVVADDQSAVREGLVLLLGTVPGIAVIGEAEDGEAAVEAVAAKDPQVVLMDLNMPRCDGVEATRRVRASHPRTQVVVLTTYSDDESIIGALRAGAVRAPAPVAEPSDNDLTPRESEVLRLIAGGKSNREIARALFVSEATVKTHVNRIFAKTGSRDRGQAMHYAYQHGYAEQPKDLYRTGGCHAPLITTRHGLTVTLKNPLATLISSSVASRFATSSRPGPGSRRIVMPSPSASPSGPARTR